jgi:hypothetical protein
MIRKKMKVKKESSIIKLNSSLNLAAIAAEILTHQNILDQNLDDKDLKKFLKDVITTDYYN